MKHWILKSSVMAAVLAVLGVAMDGDTLADGGKAARQDGEYAPSSAGPPVIVYSAFSGCAACDRLKAWLNKGGNRGYNWDVRLYELRTGRRVDADGVLMPGEDPLPAFVKVYPTFQYQTRSGWVMRSGVTGDQLIDRAKADGVMPLTAVAPKAAKGRPVSIDRSKLQQAREYLGETGTIVVTPGKAVTAKPDGSTVLRYRSIQAKYDLSTDNPVIVFTDPVPVGTYTTFGLAFGFKVLGAELLSDAKPQSIEIRTDQKRFRVTIEELNGP